MRSLVIVIALTGALIAAVAALGKLSGRLGNRMVDRLYYVSYACTGLSVLLFVLHGLFGGRR